jgi:hypothetical protein
MTSWLSAPLAADSHAARSPSSDDDARAGAPLPDNFQIAFYFRGNRNRQDAQATQDPLASCPYRNVSSHRPPALALHCVEVRFASRPGVLSDHLPSTACRQSPIIMSSQRKCKRNFSAAPALHTRGRYPQANLRLIYREPEWGVHSLRAIRNRSAEPVPGKPCPRLETPKNASLGEWALSPPREKLP